ncbi:UDP-N-acetylmuramoyl-L-alanyl-D-glutamate--2,6-diaminopimelate ligase [Acinetobacter rathckeae]|uniref:UDP-N-acetylmuramoyl-L-alanyl-D-glutamate--2, 6-diaminopimelate ligase n=1 Tax=Acinetobacter rathckeae TaxID=2605272 RepID=UPI0018A2DA31|nr:UDP-N-acetylmuramoyl-L-alanyl-D-glutamate--2,6-diaminopimelate ligase [Acinetobacter rathckeae]MBF7688699.1 UDP-N-acetylmuramoyl-L-alanyl-D-glutamate--2,6-diaminopimelate ligase [Acinetobacter rathckeae]
MSICFKDLCDVPSDQVWLTQPFTGFCLDSRELKEGQIFIALNSYSQPEKTVLFAQKARQQGALGVISESVLDQVGSLVITDVRQKIGQWQQQYLQHSLNMPPPKVVAVTGTNGKTTISRLVAEILTFVGHTVAIMGTTGHGILPNLTPSTHTTLDALQLQKYLAQYKQQGAEYVSLEASSHGLEQGRLVGCDIEVAIYSNLSHDHLDYHHTFEQYAAAKAKLFEFSTLKAAVINLDDAYADVMLTAAKNNPAQPKIITYAENRSDADFYVTNVEFVLHGVNFDLHSPQGVKAVSSPLLGQFNIDNLLASLATVYALGFDINQVISRLPELVGAPGRMQMIADSNRVFIVDYAHTPDALEQALSSVKKHVAGKLWVAFGCGGDRDRTKRPIMTKIALSQADVVVLTSDNPRTESLEQIFNDMIQGLDFTSHTAYKIDNRRDAIAYITQHAQAGDVVVIAGKGHENYQDIQGVKHFFDDTVEIKTALEQKESLSKKYVALG